ncbi:SRPBCC family protein [Amycolatopsis minnesotensis]|uniref:Polyketide cyclase/dehydrase/lipid transport protein n=1 Tax=Amycolatopsis minnesotensis TaxID=337894 RepID=A0ABP5CRV8_9PSEU
MAEASATETIACTPDELLEFVLDPERYAEVDRKIGEIEWVRREENSTRFRFRGRVPGLPGPMPKIESRMTRTPGERVDVVLPRVRANLLVNLVSEFSASWVCVPADGGTTVTRTVRFAFKGPAKWLVEPALDRALPADIVDELRQAKAYLEADTPVDGAL